MTTPDTTAAEVVRIFDAEHINIAKMPPGQHAGYTTGTPDVVWTTEDWQTHEHAVRIDQTPASGEWDKLADVQDYEKGAVTLLELQQRVKEMKLAYDTAARPGQRSPSVYVGARPNATDVVNALVASGITSGVGLAIAAPGMTDQEAIQLITNTATTPWPVIWVQNQFDVDNAYDAGWASKAWLDKVSVKPSPKIVNVTIHWSDGKTEEFG